MKFIATLPNQKHYQELLQTGSLYRNPWYRWQDKSCPLVRILSRIKNPWAGEVVLLPSISRNKSDYSEYPAKLDLKVYGLGKEEYGRGILSREIAKGLFAHPLGGQSLFFAAFPMESREIVPRFLLYQVVQAPLKRLYLIRGASGSGKSTLARELAGIGAIAADDFPGLYEGGYQQHLQLCAHKWCEEQCELMMRRDMAVIAVHNTFSRVAYLQPFLQLAAQYSYRTTIVTVEGNHGNLHGVDEEVRSRQLGLFEPLETGGSKASPSDSIRGRLTVASIHRLQ